MWILEKETVCQYLKEHYPQFDQSGEVKVVSIGDPMDDPDMDATGGFVNYLFRVSNGKETIIVKQGREEMRFGNGMRLPSDRNRREAETMEFRQVIVPQFTPKLYHVDRENAVFLMEDVSHLGSVRYRLCQNHILPKLGQMVGEFAAANSFYMSEFYLEADQFRRLAGHFRNSELREIMENWMFLQVHGEEQEGVPDHLSPTSRLLFQMTRGDAATSARLHELRHKYMCHGETCIHGDLHISNMFANETELKAIDMEYTFPGPLCYDIGYFSSSLILQYASACFRPFPTEEERVTFISYLLDSLCQVYYTFVAEFKRHWQADAKEVYRQETAFCQRMIDSFLPDVLGYAAVPCINQGHYTLLREFSELEPVSREQAQTLGTLVARQLLMHSNEYQTMEEAVADIIRVTAQFRQGL